MKKSNYLKEKQNKKLLMPKQIIKLKFIKQLNILNIPQMNCLFLAFKKIQELKKFNWEKFKQNDFEIEILTSKIFTNNKLQIQNYISSFKNFQSTKKVFEKLLALNVWCFDKEKERLTMINLFETLEFDYKQKNKIKFKFTNKFIKEIDFFLKNNIYIKQSNLINSNFSSLEIKFRILFLYLLSLQTDKNNFKKTIKQVELTDLYELLNVSAFYKQSFSDFNKFIFKPIIKKLKQTKRFKYLEFNFKKKYRGKTYAVVFKITPFNENVEIHHHQQTQQEQTQQEQTQQEQTQQEQTQQEQKKELDLKTKKINEMVFDILYNK